MEGKNYDQTTDTHLAKKYNDALFDCMMRCNLTGYVTRSEPHFDSLIAYNAAVETFFTNTFFLFESVILDIDKDNQKSLSLVLVEANNKVEVAIRDMKKSHQLRTPERFHEIQTTVSYIHKMIMFGLQKRQMLVRMSDREPRGSESIQYWNEKIGFRKGNILSDVDAKKVK